MMGNKEVTYTKCLSPYKIFLCILETTTSSLLLVCAICAHFSMAF